MGQTGRPTLAFSAGANAAPVYTFGPFRLSVPERSLRRDGKAVTLGGRAFDILVSLVEKAGQVVRHGDLIAEVWPGVCVSPGTLRVHLTVLRKALDCRPDHTRYIANIPGKGYSFVIPVSRPGALARRVDHGDGPEWPLPNAAKQLLAIPNASVGSISGIDSEQRDHDADFGARNNVIAAIANALRIAHDLRISAQSGDLDMPRSRLILATAITLLTCVAEAGSGVAHAQTSLHAVQNATHYRTATVEGLSLFYREAGPATGDVVLLLHGFPTSSHMFRNLIPTLADRYHVIAPDYPGFGQSSAPEHTQFSYTFARYASLMDQLLQKLGATRYAMYVMDYGAPVGYRLALLHPERVTALIVQNGNAYDEGLGAFWDPIKAYWADGSEAHRRALYFLVAPETTKFQYTDGVSDISRIDPDNWVHDQALLDRPGNRDIQLDLFHDYGTNVPLYPEFQAFFRKFQPPTLIVWGKNDKIFPAAGASPYLRDLPKAELHLLDTGHFALEDKLDVMAPMIRQFLDRSIPAK